MERRRRRSRDRRSALHLFLESQLAARGARSMRLTRKDGEIVAAVGNDAYTDEWSATWTLRVEGDELVVAAAGGEPDPAVARGVARIIDRTEA